MSMILALTTASDATIERVLADPPLVWRVIAPEDAEFFEEGQAGDAADLPIGDDELLQTDLDKAWHGIHFLLTGSAWGGEPPLNFLVAGGTQVGDVDVGYGPAHAFRAAEVAAIHRALEGIGEDDLRARFDPAKLVENEIYPDIWDRDPEEDDTLEYLLEAYEELKTFVAGAARRGVGLVIDIQ